MHILYSAQKGAILSSVLIFFYKNVICSALTSNGMAYSHVEKGLRRKRTVNHDPIPTFKKK